MALVNESMYLALLNILEILRYELTVISRSATTKLPSAMTHLAPAASVKPSPAVKKMITKTTFTRVAQIMYNTFKEAHAMRKKPAISERAS